MSPSVQLITSVLLMISMSNALEFCTKKSLFGDDQQLTCLGQCCGLTAYTRTCCSSDALDNLSKGIKNAADSLSNHGSTYTISSKTTLSTIAIVGISIGSIAFIALVGGIIACVACCSSSSRRPGHVIAPNQPGVTVVTAGHTNPVYPGPQQGGPGIVYPPPPVQAYAPPPYTQPSKP